MSDTLLLTVSFDWAASCWFQGSFCRMSWVADDSPDQPYWGLLPQEQDLSSTLTHQCLFKKCFQLLSSLGTACPCPWTLAHTRDSWLGGRVVLSLWVCLEISSLCLTQWPPNLASALPHHLEGKMMDEDPRCPLQSCSALCVRCHGMGWALLPSPGPLVTLSGLTPLSSDLVSSSA